MKITAPHRVDILDWDGDDLQEFELVHSGDCGYEEELLPTGDLLVTYPSCDLSYWLENNHLAEAGYADRLSPWSTFFLEYSWDEWNDYEYGKQYEDALDVLDEIEIIEKRLV
jgi:hypothetical protein